MKKMLSTHVINGRWFEVCVQQGGEIRDVIVENNLRDADRRADVMAGAWPDCDMVFIREHNTDVERGPGASKFHVHHKLTRDFLASISASLRS